jgi:predicted TIM-barrel fold metal-dependent hydrolase
MWFKTGMGKLDIRRIPNFCGHEHWGSIASIGMEAEGFRADVIRGALPRRATGLADLLIDPYFDGMLRSEGKNANSLAKEAGAADVFAWAASDPEKAFAAINEVIESQKLIGTYQCVRRGIVSLYGIDIDPWKMPDIVKANASIGMKYRAIFSWYRDAMKHAGFSELIRIVHPEYYVREGTPESALEEAAFTRTIMRVDPFMGLWKAESPRREGLKQLTGIDPVDAESWRAFVAAVFQIAEKGGAVGVKQLQAYSRPLLYAKRSDGDVLFRGELNSDQVRAFQDWVMHECCKQVDARGWVHQIHVGTHNLTQSSPMPLLELAKAYPKMRIVMLHCWPFLQEAGWLAKQQPNIYIDTCWEPILNPEFYREALRLWLNYVPASKITCSHDATSVEMAVGSSLFTREILTDSLEANRHVLGAATKSLETIAADLLHNNSVRVYGFGDEFVL